MKKTLYYIMTIFIFIALWKITGILWDALVPFNYKTELFGILIVLPFLIGISFILSSWAFKVIRNP